MEIWWWIELDESRVKAQFWFFLILKLYTHKKLCTQESWVTLDFFMIYEFCIPLSNCSSL